MYNTDFTDQLEAFRNDLIHRPYRSSDSNTSITYEPCIQNEHGEWVPSKLETSIDS